MPETVDLLLHGAVHIVTCRAEAPGPKRGASLADPGLVSDGAIAVTGGRILAVGTEAEVRRAIGEARVIEEYDAGGRVVMPGWVDPHTHAVFTTYRADEYEARLRGDTYLEIERRGGGIKRTVSGVRAASEEALVDLSRRRLRKMLAQGVTTMEIKSGYGLELESELKMLRVISRLRDELPIDIAATFMGAHQKPPEAGDDYVRMLVEEMIPAVADSGLAEFNDIFCEEGVFDIEETARILEAGHAAGLRGKVHADEIVALGGTELAARMNAISVEHLTKITPSGIAALAGSETVAVLLPATTFGLGSRDYAPARSLVEAGAAVALATDFNPGSNPSSSMPFAVAIACSQMRLLPGEAVNAATYNAACAIGRETEAGSLEAGKKADMVVYDVGDFREIPARPGTDHAAVVFKEGRVVSERPGYVETSEVIS